MLNAKRPHFFEVFNPNLSSERLKIPVRFIKRMEGRTSGSVSLVGPSGKTWHVNLIQFNDELFLQDGWSAFVKDHFIEGGDSLVFRYDGLLNFTVQVFDTSACEKEAAFCAECSQGKSNVGEKREREKAAACSQDTSEGLSKKMKGSSTQKPGSTRNTTSIDNALGSQSKWSLSKNLSAREEKKAAQAFNSRFPNFVRIMKKFNIGGSYTLKIPYEFSMAFLPKCKIKITLRNLKGGYWTVNSVATTKIQTFHTFCGGWMAFVRGNDIKMGDTCIFELVGKCEFRVHIFGVGKLKLDFQSVKTVKGLTIGDAAEPLRNFDEPKNIEKNSPQVHLEGRIEKEISGKKMSHSEESRKTSKVGVFNNNEKKESSALKSSALNQKPAMKGLGAPEEEKVAQSFKSSFPYFVRVMKKFNVRKSYVLKIPSKFCVAHLPRYKTEIVLRNLEGESWSVNSIPPRNGGTTHSFCGGWMTFVCDNDVEMGDICIFELVGKREMRVQIFRVGKKGHECEKAAIGGLGSV